jgi:hypothetical protein
MTRLGTVLGATLLVVGCATDGDAPIQGLMLTSRSDTHVAGTFSNGDGLLVFDARMPEEGVLDIRYEVDDVVIASRLDLNQGVGAYDFGDAALDESHRALFEGAYDAISSALPQEETGSNANGQLQRQLSYLAEAPLGEPIAAFDYAVDRGWTYISCTCSYQYIGSGYYRWAGRGCTCGGGNGCKGRCGSGCGGVGWVVYTQDCAKHDYGLGSWTAASDDYCCASNNCNGGC